jgi:hypothetical protein
MNKSNTINMPIPYSFLPTSKEFEDYCIEFENFWKNKRYFVHKTDSYKNNKRKLAKFASNYLFLLIPYKNIDSYGFNTSSEGKLIDEETLNKYWKEVDENTFFFLEIDNIVTN